eukprot:jgi/Botrbrau1/21323/Bobra.0184s0033.1
MEGLLCILEWWDPICQRLGSDIVRRCIQASERYCVGCWYKRREWVATPPEDSPPAHAIFVHEDAAGPGPERAEGTTRVQATINVVNIYMGIGLLSMPYAMRLGGWLAIGALFLATTTFCYSGRLLVKAFDKLPPGAVHTYPALGVAAIGRPGKYLVASLAMTEYFAASALMLIVIWKELLVLVHFDGLLTTSVFSSVVLVSLAGTLPLLLIPSFRRLSWLSGLGCLCSTLITITVLACVAMDPYPSAHAAAAASKQALGILGCLSVARPFCYQHERPLGPPGAPQQHEGPPGKWSSGAHVQAFDSVLVAGFSLMGTVYGLVAAAGYYYFGDLSAEIITDSLARDSPFAGRSLLVPGVTIDRIVALCILLKAYTTYPCLVMVLQVCPQYLPCCGRMQTRQRPPLATVYSIRLFFFVCGAGLAYVAFGFLGDVMSLVGGFCSLSCSLLMPAGFHLALTWKEQSSLGRARGLSLLFVGLALLVLIVGQSILSIVAKIRSGTKGGVYIVATLLLRTNLETRKKIWQKHKLRKVPGTGPGDKDGHGEQGMLLLAASLWHPG